MSRDLQALSDAVAEKAREAARIHAELGEALAQLGAALGRLDTTQQAPTGGRSQHARWTEEEDAILAAEYPNGGSQGVHRALTAAGHPERTSSAITTRAHANGLRTNAAGRLSPAERILAVIRDYRGLPLSVDDVRDEIGKLSRAKARELLDELTGAGLIATRPMSHGTFVWYDPNAETEEAA